MLQVINKWNNQSSCPTSGRDAGLSQFEWNMQFREVNNDTVSLEMFLCWVLKPGQFANAEGVKQNAGSPEMES